MTFISAVLEHAANLAEAESGRECGADAVALYRQLLGACHTPNLACDSLDSVLLGAVQLGKELEERLVSEGLEPSVHATLVRDPGE
jgi:hypothetical protein